MPPNEISNLFHLYTCGLWNDEYRQSCPICINLCSIATLHISYHSIACQWVLNIPREWKNHFPNLKTAGWSWFWNAKNAPVGGSKSVNLRKFSSKSSRQKVRSPQSKISCFRLPTPLPRSGQRPSDLFHPNKKHDLYPINIYWHQRKQQLFLLALQCNPEAVQSCLGRNRLFRAQTSHAFTFFFPGKTVMIPSLTVSPGIRISSFPAYFCFNRVIWNQILESPHSVCSGPNLDCSQVFPNDWW